MTSEQLTNLYQRIIFHQLGIEPMARPQRARWLTELSDYEKIFATAERQHFYQVAQMRAIADVIIRFKYDKNTTMFRYRMFLITHSLATELFIIDPMTTESIQALLERVGAKHMKSDAEKGILASIIEDLDDPF